MTNKVLIPTLSQRMLRLFSRVPIPRRRGLYTRLSSFRDNSPREFLINFYGLQYRGILSEYIDRHIYFFGSYSPLELLFLKQSARVLRKLKGKVVFIDVGANVGQHSLFMSRYVDEVVAFEPNGDVARRFENNITINYLLNILLIRLALGSERGEARLGSGLDDNSGSRSLVWSNHIELDTVVPVISGDQIFEQLDIRHVDIIKIDVEGYEKNVLSGMRNTLERDRPIILFELVGTELKGGFKSEAELRSCLYSEMTLFTLGGKSKPKLQPFKWGAEEAVCLPNELLGEFFNLVSA